MLHFLHLFESIMRLDMAKLQKETVVNSNQNRINSI